MTRDITIRAVLLLTILGAVTASILALVASQVEAEQPQQPQQVTRIDGVLHSLITGDGMLGDPYLGLK